VVLSTAQIVILTIVGQRVVEVLGGIAKDALRHYLSGARIVSRGLWIAIVEHEGVGVISLVVHVCVQLHIRIRVRVSIFLLL